MQVQIELPNNFLNDIEYIKQELTNLKKHFQPKEPNEYLTRLEVSKLLKIDLSSVHNWTKKGLLQSYQIGGRVYYKLKEVESSIVKLNK
ncbi:helix-turn-helix domain-containing protein [Polaribacter glomeratus]|uniref:DNA-binding protein n=1 Tax=Polaribacter glomeratus TaxID=102 RepID=A0A2S7X070_9FLAO|nr:helix-turn-helix domain-containing protein [Polaribacter glomeratus]PQJ83022.1 DNA-binding protein [Polaribacter glomeratus]TXD64917.1 helix-turn-helix domain-containing protein [Polaribacter glomeratus]